MFELRGIYKLAEQENVLADVLEAKCRARIAELSEEEAADVLGFAACGLPRLLCETWNLSTAVRAASLLGIPLLDELVKIVENGA